MSLTVASFAVMDSLSCGDISIESPVDNRPTCEHQDQSVNLPLTALAYMYRTDQETVKKKLE